MPPSLCDLEQQREVLAQRIAELGDLRPGSITGTSGRCGKPECHCHQPRHPGHGPNFRLTYNQQTCLDKFLALATRQRRGYCLSGFVASTSEGELGGRELHKLFARAKGWPLILGQDHHGRNPHRETDRCARDDVADAAFWNEKRAEHAYNYGRPHNVITRRSQYPR
jgi:hypothetical protein